MKVEYHLYEVDYEQYTMETAWVFRARFESEEEMFALMEREKQQRADNDLRPRTYKFETIYK